MEMENHSQCHRLRSQNRLSMACFAHKLSSVENDLWLLPSAVWAGYLGKDKRCFSPPTTPYLKAQSTTKCSGLWYPKCQSFTWWRRLRVWWLQTSQRTQTFLVGGHNGLVDVGESRGCQSLRNQSSHVGTRAFKFSLWQGRSGMGRPRIWRRTISQVARGDAGLEVGIDARVVKTWESRL